MGTAGVELFDAGTAAGFTHGMERSRRRSRPSSDPRTGLAQPLDILKKHDSNDHVRRGLRDHVILPRFAGCSLGPEGMMGIIPIAISLSTGQ